jgi:hypothetical protein
MGWIAVDLDGTLAEYHGWPKDGSIGAPVPKMVERVKQWLAQGKDVRIFTARIWPLGTSGEPQMGRMAQALLQWNSIANWCAQHIGKVLPVTCVKDYGAVEFWDDRAVQVVANTGLTLEEKAMIFSVEMLGRAIEKSE